jgi:hypothetical protein
MRTFEVECPECDCEMDVDIEESDLADTDLGHLVTCADCQAETEYVYDADFDELVSGVDLEEEEEDDPEETDE